MPTYLYVNLFCCSAFGAVASANMFCFQPLRVVGFPHSLSRPWQGDNAGESPLQLLASVKAKLGFSKSCDSFVPLEYVSSLLLFQHTAA